LLGLFGDGGVSRTVCPVSLEPPSS
jgi:hypothetical protein